MSKPNRYQKCPGWTQPTGMSTSQALDGIEREWATTKRTTRKLRGVPPAKEFKLKKATARRPSRAPAETAQAKADRLFSAYQASAAAGATARRAWWAANGKAYLAAVKASRSRTSRKSKPTN